MKSFLALCLSVVALSAVNPASSMKMAFSDEFDGGVLDATKWASLNDSGAVTMFKADKVGCVRISMVKNGDKSQTNGITTRGKFEQVRGYFEASMRMNAFKGQGGSMYLHGNDAKVLPSITLFWSTEGGDYLSPWAQLIDAKGQRDIRSDASGTKLLRAGEASKKFNTYGFLWAEKSFAWYLNGKQVHKADRVAIATPMSLTVSRFNLNPVQVPDALDIDWVKVWK
jgi:beta-glucanase (GH16 family)